MKKIISILLALLTIMSVSAKTVSAKTQTDTLWLQGSEGKLHAILQTPGKTDKGVKYPLVILCHGFSGNCESSLMTDLSSAIVSEGMATLRFDFNGHGKSEGLFQNMTVLNEIEDLKDVIKYAQTLPWVESISLLGHSQGGVVVSMVSGELGDKTIKAEVLLAAAAVLRDDALRGSTFGATFDPWDFKGDYVESPYSPELGSLRIGKAYIETATRLPIYETAANYNGPALIIQGTHDRIVPYTYAERYHEKIANSELKLIPDENHMFSETQKETALLAADWLHKILIK